MNKGQQYISQQWKTTTNTRVSTSFALQVILEVCRRALGMNYPWDTRLDVGGSWVFTLRKDAFYFISSLRRRLISLFSLFFAYNKITNYHFIKEILTRVSITSKSISNVSLVARALIRTLRVRARRTLVTVIRLFITFVQFCYYNGIII